MLNLLFSFKRLIRFFYIISVLFVVTLDAFTGVWAWNTRVEALTILFLAKWFFTIATFLGKTARMNPFLFNIFLCFFNYIFIWLNVFTITTLTILVACFTVSKTFTVHFQTERFFTCTSNTFFLTRTCHRFRLFYSKCKRVFLLWLFGRLLVMFQEVFRMELNVFFGCYELHWILHSKRELRKGRNVESRETRKVELVVIFFVLLCHKIILINPFFLIFSNILRQKYRKRLDINSSIKQQVNWTRARWNRQKVGGF